jgi:N-acetylglucosamine transport system permease protein
MEHMQKRNRISQFIIYLLLILFALSILIPIMWVLMASLKSESELMSGEPFAWPEKLIFENYNKAWFKAKMGTFLWGSVSLTAFSLVLLLITALPAAYVLARFEFGGKKLLNALYMAGLFVNINYIALPIYVMLFNLEVKWDLTNVFINNKVVLAVIYAASSLPFTVYLLTSYFKTLAVDYEEAAAIDGSGYFQTMVRIMFPMALPSIVTVIMFQFLTFWNEYVLAFTFLEQDNATLPVGLKYLMATSKAQSETGVMYAGLVIVMIPVLLLYILVQKKLIEGMTVGGLKG